MDNNEQQYQTGYQYQATPGNNYVPQQQPVPTSGSGGGQAPQNQRVIIIAIIIAAIIVAAAIITAVVLLNKKEEPEQRAKVFVFTEYEQTIDEMEEALRAKDGKVPQGKEKELLKKEYDYVIKDNQENRLFERVTMEYNPCQLICVLGSGQTYYHVINDVSCVKDDKGKVVESESVAQDKEKPAEIDYSALEEALNRYAYGYIGGSMEFAYHNQKIYFADYEYNTSEVMYFDLSDSRIHTLAKDDNNAVSAPCILSNTSVLVKSVAEPVDPLETDWSKVPYHVYDYDSGELLVLDTKFDFQYALSYEDGKVYGADENCICIANADGSDTQRLPFYADDPYWWKIYNYKGEMYVYYSEEKDQQFEYHLAKLNDNNVDVLLDTGSNVFFADNLCYYAKQEGEGYAFYCYDLETGEEQQVGSTEKHPRIYFTLGDRIYYSTPVEGSNDIAINYYDMLQNSHKQISSDGPVLGGW